MATVNATISDISGDGSVRKVVWANLTTTNTDGKAIEWVQWADRSIQVNGTFGAGGTVKLMGSNNGVDWYEITDPQGNAISKTAGAIEACTEITQYVKPLITAGDGTTSITATLILRRAQPLRT